MFISAAAILLLSAGTACGQNKVNPAVTTETHVYAHKDGEDLKLDIYVDTTVKFKGPRPVILYQHGGGWDSDDTREQGKGWLSEMSKMGYVTASIDYRLGIRRMRESGAQLDTTNFGQWYDYAITLGIEDFYDATAYLVKNAKKLNIDPKKIIASGGSAGATDVVSAEYRLVNGDTLAVQHLPKDFNYAAIISCAGGVWGFGLEEPKWNKKPCPFLIFHGDKDQLVPYDHLLIPASNYSAWGPLVYARQLKEMEVPYLFLTGKDCDHALSGLPFANCRELMDCFLKRVVFDGEQLVWEMSESYLDEPRTLMYVIKNLAKYQ
jgi:acetyl esterase/lipase